MVLPATESSPQPLKHTITIWLVLLGVLIGAFATTVLVLNATLYSAGGFVGSYLSALARHDATGALNTPGVLGTAQASDKLLVPAALGTLEDIRTLSDDDMGDGLHAVDVEYTIDGKAMRSTYQVRHTGTKLGFFTAWTFETSPIGVLQVLPLHDASFAVNGIRLTSPGGPDAVANFQVLTPGVFHLTHESDYLKATPVTVSIAEGSGATRTQIDIQANATLITKIQNEVNNFLDECTTSTVLFPTGCPFGQELSNRVESTPVWSMARYPEITIEPGKDVGTWVIPNAQGAAHLKVEVRSLFDGTLSTFDEDVQFSLRWLITFDDDKVNIQAQ